MYDYKKEFKEQYKPKTKPTIINIPSMNYLTVEGKGDPGLEDGEYIRSIGLLYGVAYTLKMSYKGDYKIKDFIQYVVPPLEGYWWQTGIKGYDKTKKDLFEFISLIRLPDFITKEDFNWAINKATLKNNINYNKVELIEYEEGLVVQCLHIGDFDEEERTTKIMHDFIEGKYKLDFENRNHHEIYLSDYRKTEKSKLKTILRHPIKEI